MKLTLWAITLAIIVAACVTQNRKFREMKTKPRYRNLKETKRRYAHAET